MKKIIFIGSVGCGKTTLAQAILGDELEYKKTQSVEVFGNSILDTPGEYLEMVHFRGAVAVISSDAEIIGLVQSATEERNMFPPCYAGSFAKEVIGIVTKIDIASKESIEEAERLLLLAGASRVFKISSYTGEGIGELIEYLK